MSSVNTTEVRFPYKMDDSDLSILHYGHVSKNQVIDDEELI